MKIAGYEYHSCLSPYIQQFLQEKGDSGFIYESEEWILKHLDAFCLQRWNSQPFLSKELVTEWWTLKAQEEMVTCSKRISVLLKFGFYMISLGKETYIPRHFYKSIKGAEASATVYSITETALLNGLKPYDYVAYILERMKDLGSFPSKEDLQKLLPWSESIPESCRTNRPGAST